MKKIISVALFGIVFCAIFSYTSKILENKDGQSEYAPFFEEEGAYDVLFFGSSVATSGISPLDLWKDYGICSYNLANNGQTLALNYYCMKNALSMQRPKLCVVDLTYLPKTDLINGEGRLHEFLDSMPLFSKERMEVLKELVPKEEWGNYLIPMVYYHGRWKELKASDFQSITSINRGGTIMEKSIVNGVTFDTSVFTKGLNLIDEHQTASIPEENVKYCKKMAELCREYGVEILFVHFPHYISDEYYNGNAERVQAQYNEFANVIKDYENAIYVNFNYRVEQIGFDYVEHMRDYTHLNIEGNRKMTEVLGEYITENYEIPDRKDDESLKNWESDWEIWDKYRDDLLEDNEL